MIREANRGRLERAERNARTIEPERLIAAAVLSFAVAISTTRDGMAAEAVKRATEVRESVSQVRSGSLDVDVLVAEVIAQNPTLSSMREAERAAQERFPQVTALDDPRFSWSIAPETIGKGGVNLGQKLELSQELPWPGKLSARGDMARNEAEAAAGEVDATRLRLVEATHETYYQWWFVHRAIAINDENRELLAELRRIAEARYGAGLSAKQDALQAEVELQHLVHRGIVLERQRGVTRAQLNALRNAAPKRPVAPPPPALVQPTAVPPREALEAAALDRRPALLAQRRRIEARKADVELARLELFPNLMVMAVYNSLWGTPERRTMIGAGINVPIQLERRRAALGEARAELQRAESLLRGKEAEVLFEVSRALDELREQEHVVRLYETSFIPAAEESLAAARSGYESAANDFLTLIQAEKALLVAALEHEQGLAGCYAVRARLARAVGGPLDEVEESR